MKIYQDHKSNICQKEIAIFQWERNHHSKTIQQEWQQPFQPRMEALKSEIRKLQWMIISKGVSKASSISLEGALPRKKMNLIMGVRQVQQLLLGYSLNTIHHLQIRRDPSRKDLATIS
jgi:hypothetical protein